MGYAKKSNYSAQKRPSQGGQAQSGTQSTGDQSTKTTHYAKDADGNFVDNVFIWENDNKFGGKTIKLRVSETLQPGDYFVNRRRTDS